MDLSKFTNKSRGSGSSAEEKNFLKKNYYRLKYWLLPPTTDRRKERVQQYKDLGLFITAVAAIAIFEDKIKNFLEIETDDLRKLSMESSL